MKRTVKRILAVLLTAVMLLSVAPMSVFAKENVTDGTAEGVMSDVNLKATNSVGELVTKALEKNGLDAESEYGVTGLDFDGKTATVTGFAKENCALIVAIYDENSNRMLASGIGEFSEDEQTASVEISTTQMPEYFVAYAFLLMKTDRHYAINLLQESIPMTLKNSMKKQLTILTRIRL